MYSGMEKHSVDAIVGALNMANVRYLVAGGLAVVAHGYVRFTADVDLIVDLEPANVMRAVASLESLGYRPRAPVAFGEFADPQKRAQVHNDGRGARYTAGRRPVRLVYWERCASVGHALRREYQLKQWSHARKEGLIASLTKS